MSGTSTLCGVCSYKLEMGTEIAIEPANLDQRTGGIKDKSIAERKDNRAVPCNELELLNDVR